MREPPLRVALQRCPSRVRLALSALEDFQQVFINAVTPLPRTDVAQLVGMLEGVRHLLTGEEVDHGL